MNAEHSPYRPDKFHAEKFVEMFKELQRLVHFNARAKGFWDDDAPSVAKLKDASLIALTHSELSEALEAIRHGNPPSEHIPEFSAVEEELADVVLRIMDMSHARGLNVARSIVAKMEYNLGRAHKHGGKTM